jgi:hypothetical protein
MLDTKTKELPLVSAPDAPTAQVPQMPVAANDQTRRIAPEQVPMPPPGPDLPSPFSNPNGDLRTAQIAPHPSPFPPPVASPPPFNPAALQPTALASQEPVKASPAVRRPRRWPVAIASWLGGMVAGMLILTLALGFFGGPREVSANTGDSTAAWDTSITLTDAYLTAQARKNGSAQVQEPSMHVKADGTIAMDGKASLFGRSVPVSGTLQPIIVDGKLKMEIVNMNLGGLNLPEFVVTQIQGNMASAAQPPAAAAAMTIVKLEASEGKLVIYSKLQ